MPHPESALYAELVAIGRSVSRDPEAEPVTLYDRHGVLVVRVGDVAVKTHQADRDNGPALTRRLAVAAELPELLLTPNGPPRHVLGRVVTVWPYGEPVSPDDPPWEEGARLLARLHTTSPRGQTPPLWGRPSRAARVVAKLGTSGDDAEIRRAFGTLPAWIRGDEPPPTPRQVTLTHGDWHLGQLVSLSDKTWRLIDIEDLGLGDPAWDLARPAALFSAGVLPGADWARFLNAYRASGGPAVPANGGEWDALDVPARTLAIQIAATCVISAREENRSLDELESALVDTCRRISDSGMSAGR